MSFSLYSPHHQRYLGTEYRNRWVEWAKEARPFDSVKEANDFAQGVGWRNSTDASDPLAVYAVELIG